MVLFFFLSSLAFAQDSNVILFGAEGTDLYTMERCYPDIWVVPYDQAANAIPMVVAQIDGNPEKSFVVAGHSSASVNAERVAQKIRNKKQIRLVLLDGYGNEAIQNQVDTTCWYATDGKSGLSVNAHSMMNRQDSACNQKKSHTKIHRASHCKTEWCLHFSLVNENAPSALSSKLWYRKGYENCRANLHWLRE